ncbi:telomeric repeat-binding factor 2-interacting protein 1 isoform X1 [Solea solea]|uniref:telomeric repeat-binding factor 2-interacting protein 1 isoform X1 n=1 Tax=Solea solea TaxID=90069 RepID=UPI00272C97AF|nr:telomeric repeat-binding factor 2-interacting protein 1 isoform X1 [Solea solea]
MMPSKPQEDVAKSDISQVLFTTDGKPMYFYLRPGHVKRKLQPLITSGGGMLCNVQQPGAILLIDPEERVSIPETTAHWYVSTMYIQDCIDKNQQLNIEDYRLNPEDVPRHSTRLNSSKNVSARFTGGRVPYTPEEDAAILKYVSKHKADTGGNRLWQEMEKQRVTVHSWQSMKYRYRIRLAKKPSDAEEVKTTEEVSEEEENEESDVSQPCSENAAPPQTHSPAAEALRTDLSQKDVQTIAAESTDPENAEAETSNLPQPEEPCLSPQMDANPTTAESIETEATISPQKEDSPRTVSPEKQKEKQGTPPGHRVSCRKLEFKVSPMHEPVSKRLRSPSTSASSEKPPPSPQPAKKKQSPVKPAVHKQTSLDSPASKRARGKSVAVEAVSHQGETVEAIVSKTPQLDEESESLPQKGEKKTEKRKLGILELATKEFEDDTETSDDESLDVQNPAEVVVAQSTAINPPSRSSDKAVNQASTQSNPESDPEPSIQERAQQAQTLSSDCVPETGRPESEATDPPAAEAFIQASRAHLFIFESESQQEDSQSLIGDGTTVLSKPQPRVHKDTAPSLTQVQLEEDVQRIKALMNHTNGDLVSVTKALLKTSGDFSAALELLMDPSTISRPCWNRCDDGLLLSADPVVRQQLQEKYGEMEVAKRIVFLEMEG